MKGATRERNDARAIANILIHAPMKGATSKSHKIDSDFAVLFRKFI